MNATRSIRRYILASLSDGNLARGARLPAERTLAVRLGLSRSAVRDALLMLEAEGRIDRRRGSGTYVAAPRARSGALPASSDVADVSPADLMEARLAIEPQFAELIVANATSSDFDVLEECNRRTALAHSSDDFREWNARLHQAMAAATRNDFLIHVFGLVTHSLRHSEWGELSRRPTTRELRTAYQTEHDSIVRALRARNVDAARSGISEHLRHARRNLLGY